MLVLVQRSTIQFPHSIRIRTQIFSYSHRKSSSSMQCFVWIRKSQIYKIIQFVCVPIYVVVNVWLLPIYSFPIWHYRIGGDHFFFHSLFHVISLLLDPLDIKLKKERKWLHLFERYILIGLLIIEHSVSIEHWTLNTHYTCAYIHSPGIQYTSYIDVKVAVRIEII